MIPFRDWSYFVTVVISFATFMTLLLSSSLYASTISGFVYTTQRVALVDVDVELLNENRQFRNRVKTDGSGRYSFAGLADGYYYVKALPFRYDLDDQEFMVEVTTLKIAGSGVGNVFVTQDFYLAPKRGGLASAELAVIFAQDVPKEARSLYASAVQDLAKNRRVEGIRALRDAVALFPKYFDASQRLGKELFASGEFGEAVQLFMTCAEVNPKSAVSLYLLGSALHNLGSQFNKGALVALKSALERAPASVQVLYLIGRIERLQGDFVNAEKHLIKAKQLSRQNVPEIHRELAQLYSNNLKKYGNAADELELYLKASNLNEEDKKKTRGVIAGLREKSKRPSSN